MLPQYQSRVCLSCTYCTPASVRMSEKHGRNCSAPSLVNVAESLWLRRSSRLELISLRNCLSLIWPHTPAWCSASVAAIALENLTEARIFWVDLPLNEKDTKLAAKDVLDRKEQERIALPYTWHELETARALLANMQSAAPADLPVHHDPFMPAHVLRRRDLIDLFDTTPDLSGYDLDISRFVRGGDERDVAVAWRELGGSAPQPDGAASDA